MAPFKVYKRNEEVAYVDMDRQVLVMVSDNTPPTLFCHNSVREIDYRYFTYWLTYRTYSVYRADIDTLLKRDDIRYFDIETVITKTGGRKISDDYWIGVESKPC